jgi:hypothetical protein
MDAAIALRENQLFPRSKYKEMRIEQLAIVL